jgi:hypothetical protein
MRELIGLRRQPDQLELLAGAATPVGRLIFRIRRPNPTFSSADMFGNRL